MCLQFNIFNQQFSLIAAFYEHSSDLNWKFICINIIVGGTDTTFDFRKKNTESGPGSTWVFLWYII